MSGDVLAQKCLLTLQGNFLTVASAQVMIDGAEIIVLDIECSNGVIHVIDAVMVPEKPAIHPVEKSGWANVYKRGKYCFHGRARLEIYPFNSLDHPGGNPHAQPVCAWVVKITICARGWVKNRCDHARRARGHWKRVHGTIEMFWTVKCWKQFGNRMYLTAAGHEWTWNGNELPGEPSDITVRVRHCGSFRVKAWGCGIRFCG
jgi:hypothetical protein